MSTSACVWFLDPNGARALNSSLMRFRRVNADESIPFGIVGCHRAVSDVIYPPVEAQVSLAQTRRHHRMRAKILDLFNDIAFGERDQEPGTSGVRLGGFCRASRGSRMVQPLRHAGQRLKSRRIQNALHHAAIGVPADDDVGDAQHPHRVFDGRGNSADRLGVARHDVADHPANEKLAGFGLGQ